ncbi:mitochondrial dicarboxylate [Purpureocillium lavendulum]|uniref:Mitochondrial dicarboxylate n=1 Tax=Purpureocillium lavendulum TaxID=1247861 RepID=A0AB34FVS5_9HYPO|nr:mitochondrial dicarboxylate [Purpureocillium lavendulum]
MTDKKRTRTKAREPFWLGKMRSILISRTPSNTNVPRSRMQVLKSSNSMLSTLSRFATRDGIPSLWAGLSASILRQGTYSTARFGIHAALSESLLRRSGRDTLPLSWNVACAGLAGGLAGLIGNPTEVVLVRMCADGAKSPQDRFRYSNALVGLARVWSDEGARAFTKGIAPNVARSVLMNVSQIATYASAKQYLVQSAGRKDDIATHVLASLAAGTVATTLCAPADVLKSRMQSSSAKDGLFQVVRTGLREEGPRFLMKGWTPAWLRLTPHTVLTFVFIEQLRKLTQIQLFSRKEEPAKL